MHWGSGHPKFTFTINFKNTKPIKLGLDGDQIEKMSLEEALSVMQSNSREGQTWQQGDNLQCQVINGTTYFTPVGNYKTKER